MYCQAVGVFSKTLIALVHKSGYFFIHNQHIDKVQYDKIGLYIDVN